MEKYRSYISKILKEQYPLAKISKTGKSIKKPKGYELPVFIDLMIDCIRRGDIHMADNLYESYIDGPMVFKSGGCYYCNSETVSATAQTLGGDSLDVCGECCVKISNDISLMGKVWIKHVGSE